MLIIFFLFLFNFIIINHQYFVISILPDVEIQALKEFYLETNGENWFWNDDTNFGKEWNFTVSNQGKLIEDPCYDNWQGIDCSCSELGDTPFDYSYYYYSGEEKNSFLCTITAVNLIEFNLAGALPISFQNLKNLSFLHLASNSLQGRALDVLIPALSKLTIIGLAQNLLTGTIPLEINQLTNLRRFIIRENEFTGKLPESLAEMNLFAFDITGNTFTGSLPNILDSSVDIGYFDVSNNLLSGSISSKSWNNPSAWYLNFALNSFTGELPVFTDLSSLVSISIAYNYFEGNCQLDTLSESIGIAAIMFTSSSCTGTIPSALGDREELIAMDFEDNLLSGSIPDEIGQLSKLWYLTLSWNQLTSTIPNSFSNLISMRFLFLHENQFIGTFPNLMNWNTLIDFSIHNNHFTGKIPSLPWERYDDNNDELVAVPLRNFLIQNNYFEGLIPIPLLQLSSSLLFLLLQNNLFTGFDTAGYNKDDDDENDLVFLDNVQVIDFSSNYIEGSLPKGFFTNSTNLQTFVSASNCLSSFDLEIVCNTKDLRIFSLDGMNKACHQDKPHAISYTIPSCLMMMNQLQLLHLSGINLIGTIPNDLTSSINDLSFSHNQLTGTIPHEFQLNIWKFLDLSFNKLTGEILNPKNMSLLNAHYQELQNNNLTKSVIRTQVNRLSGSIPLFFRELTDLNILNGNIFSCLIGEESSSLPPNDPETVIYSCGTNSLNILLYIWFSCFILLMMILLIVSNRSVIKSLKELFHNFISWPRLNIYDEQEQELQEPQQDEITATDKITKNKVTKNSLFHKELSVISYGIKSIQYIYFRYVVIMILIFMPIYLILNHFYSTHEFTYAFQVSGGYLSGTIPAILLAILWLCLTLLTSFYSHRIAWFTEEASKQLEIAPKSIDFYSLFKNHSNLGRRFLMKNIIVYLLLSSYILAINIAFIYSQVNYNAEIAAICQVTLAIIELLTSHVLIPRITKLTHQEIQSFPFENQNPSITKEIQEKWIKNNQMMMEISLAIISNIVAPCIAAAISSSSCYYYQIFQAPLVETIYYIPECHSTLLYLYIIKLECREYFFRRLSIQYQPDFNYSFQCSSFLLNNYTSVFVNMFLINSFIRPIGQWIMNKTKEQWKKIMNSRKIIPIHDMNNEIVEMSTKKNDDDVNDLLEKQLDDDDGSSSLKQKKLIKKENSNHSSPVKYFKKEAFLLQLIVSASISLTFGLIYPPLAFIITFQMIRFLQESEANIRKQIAHHTTSVNNNYPDTNDDYDHDDRDYSDRIENLRQELLPMMSELHSNLHWQVIPIAILFQAYFLFDILGDQMGWSAGVILAIIFMIAFTSINLLFSWCHRRGEEQHHNDNTARRQQQYKDTSVVDSSKNILAVD